jgi:hypothetical protein
MDWKDFFKPNFAKLIILIVVILLLISSMYALQKTSFSVKNPDVTIHIGIPITLTKNSHCCGFSQLESGYGFCKCGVSSDYEFSFVNLVLNLIWIYITSCLIWNAYIKIKSKKK